MKLEHVAGNSKIPMQGAAVIFQVKTRLEETVAIARGPVRPQATGRR